MAFREVWDTVTDRSHEAVPAIKVRVAALQVGAETVIRLGCVGDVVLAVRRVINRVRPGVIDGRSKTAAIAKRETGLQCVVIGIGGRLQMVDVKERAS